MIRLDVEPGSLAWLEARMAIPTASNFGRILTPKTMRISAQAETYRNELLSEWLLGEPFSGDITEFMQRGTELEPDAIAWYEMQRDADVSPPGFLLTDDRRYGATPDGLIGTEGGLEIKCPSAAVHVGYLLDMESDKYKAQVQGGLLVSERDWWDLVSYHPTLPSVVVRVYRDEAFIEALRGVLTAFCDQLDAAKEYLQSRGIMPAMAT
jgi:hypothetical protein